MSIGGRTTYRVKLQVITPLFIGGGESTNLTRLNYGFIPEEKKVYVLDERKWVDYLAKKGLLNDFIQYLKLMAGAKSGGVDIFVWLKGKETRLKAKAEAVLKQVSSRVYSTAGNPDFKTNNISGFIKNAFGLPYIPGSSIKGALRTAILASHLQRNENYRKSYLHELENKLNMGKNNKNGIGALSSKIESTLLDYKLQINGKEEMFRGMAGLSVSDSTPFALENLILVKKKDLSVIDGKLKGDSEKRGTLPLYRECARPGTEVEFTVTIDAVKMNSALGINTFDDIASALQKQFDALFGESGVFSVWLESKKFIPTEVLKAGGKGIMFLGGGVGYHSKSVLSSLAADPRKGNEFTKKILHVNFSRHKHFQDKPLSPRALKVAKVEGKDVFMGICRLKEVN